MFGLLEVESPVVSKERVGSRVKKTYNGAKVPYQRVLDSSQVDEASKERLRQEYAALNPVALLRQSAPSCIA